MSDPTKVVVAGGGTSGWIAAAAISKLLGEKVAVTLIESEKIGRIGVGEATIPPLRAFHKLLGINEQELMSYTQSTLKLGIEFQNWKKKGEHYIHSFGSAGKDCWACGFHHFWVKGQQLGEEDAVGSYCLEHEASLAGKALAGDDSGVNYAYHFDAGLYADYLRNFSIQQGVKNIEGIIDQVVINEQNGYIESLILEDGQQIKGDLFIDCTGFKARLIEGALNTSFESFQSYLPCDSAVAVQTESTEMLRPYTQSIAHDFGWQWKIPLQHRVGNGLVYCSRYVSDDEALETLMTNLESPAITEPRMFKYHTGRRTHTWVKNCVAVGLSNAFLEPVESTAIHLAMSAVLRLLKHFPQGRVFNPAHIDEFNRLSRQEVDRVRNFIIVHYKVTERTDSAFWRYCRSMDIPLELQNRLALFKESGLVNLEDKELFVLDSWIQVMTGQGLKPDAYHPIVDNMSNEELLKFLASIRQRVSENVKKMPSHQDFIKYYCKAKEI